MRSKLSLLLQHHPFLHLLFANSMYPAVGFNFGPVIMCYEHTDFQNDPCNLCHITALGNFNPDSGGYLILFDIKLVVRFPPGSSIFISSAIMQHGNVPICNGESRMSFTQFCPRGLLRWVMYGFHTLRDFERQDLEGSSQLKANLAGQVDECIHLFSTVESLPEDVLMNV
ncbi:hypothetical protein BD414DRAFT_420303 [Trametes punicea]|nr:hypothetical protein BD414DRAFT_420303 [Trametes punicea]